MMRMVRNLEPAATTDLGQTVGSVGAVLFFGSVLRWLLGTPMGPDRYTASNGLDRFLRDGRMGQLALPLPCGIPSRARGFYRLERHYEGG